MNFIINLVFFAFDSLKFLFLVGLIILVVNKFKQVFKISSIGAVIKAGIKITLKAIIITLEVLNKVIKTIYVTANVMIAVKRYNKKFCTEIKFVDALKGSTFTTTGLKLTANGVFLTHIPFKAKLVKFVAKVARLGIKTSLKGVYALYKRV